MRSTPLASPVYRRCSPDFADRPDLGKFNTRSTGGDAFDGRLTTRSVRHRRLCHPPRENKVKASSEGFV